MVTVDPWLMQTVPHFSRVSVSFSRESLSFLGQLVRAARMTGGREVKAFDC